MVSKKFPVIGSEEISWNWSQEILCGNVDNKFSRPGKSPVNVLFESCKFLLGESFFVNSQENLQILSKFLLDFPVKV